MKALLLAAGLGTRLRPLTDNMPKVMVPLNGKPCLQYHIENLKAQGVTEFAINTHYYPEAIKSYFGDGSRFGVKIVYSYEDPILGTAGALNNFKEFFTGPFFIVYADNFANYQIKDMVEVHKKNHALITIALDNYRSMLGKGAVLFEGERVTEFVEKPPKEIPGALINSGFYLADPKIFNEIPEGYSDFGKDILPRLVKQNKVFCSHHKGYIFDIGTHEDLKKAEMFLKNNGN